MRTPRPARLSARDRWAAAGAGGLLLIGVAGVGVTMADAATPDGGTVSDGERVASWTGTVTGTNQTGQLGAPDCTLPQSCDDYALTITGAGDYGSSHTLRIEVSTESDGADLDIFLLNSDDELVASAATADGAPGAPEKLDLPAAPGVYTVRVIPFTSLPSADYDATATITTDAGGGTTSTAVTTSTGGTSGSDGATFTDYPAPDSLAGANDAGEPSIGNNFATDATLYQAGLSTFKTTFDDTTTPATATWTDVSANLGSGCPQGSTTSLDPILFTDHETGRTFESQLLGKASATCFTDDDGASWTPSQGSGINSGVDHQTIGGGPYSADDPIGALPTSTYENIVFYCSQDIADASCASSHDGGLTFGPAVPTYSLLDCGGLHGHLKVAPDGTAYLPNKNCGGNAAVAVSGDGGTTWTIDPIPGTTSGDSDPSVGIGRNGTVYVGYVNGKADGSGVPGVAVSRDQGATYTDVHEVGQALGVKNAVFPTVVAGDDDRAAFAYLGTTTGGDYQNAATFTGEWHLYVDFTYDGGKTWTTTDATPTDPVQRGSICTGGTTCGNDRNLLDFNDVTIDDNGRVLVGFADGCITTACKDGGANDFSAYATIARQSTGKTLFAKYDAPTTPTTTSATTSTSSATTGTSSATTGTSSATTGSSTATTVTTTTTTATATAQPAARRNLRLVKTKTMLRNGHFYTRVYITNTGNKTLSSVKTSGYDNGRLRRKGNPFSIDPGQTVIRYLHWGYDAGKRTHRLLFAVDPLNKIREVNEKDNKATRTINVS